MPSTTYTTSGNHTWNRPDGTTSVDWELWGGGASPSSAGGDGGGGGAYASGTDSGLAEASYTLGVGNTGNDSTWRTNVGVAKGTTTRNGGTGSTGTVTYNGGDGGFGAGSGGGGGGGGGAAGPGGNGNNGTDASGGTGGTGGAGNGAGDGSGGNGGDNSPGNGQNGTAPGGGGGAGGDDGSSGASNGSGAVGQGKLTWTTGSIVITAQPSNTKSGSSISITVEVRNSGGSVDTNASSSVTVSIDTNVNGATLGGTTSYSPSSGVYSINACNLDNFGNGYKLAITHPDLGTVVTNTFNITADHLAFTTQPSNALAGASISPDIVVAAKDTNNNTDTNFASAITLAINNNPGGSTLTTDTNPVTASSGVSTFTHTSLNNAGTGYTLNATATGLTTATSNSFDITSAAAKPWWTYATQQVIGHPG